MNNVSLRDTVPFLFTWQFSISLSAGILLVVLALTSPAARYFAGRLGRLDNDERDKISPEKRLELVNNTRQTIIQTLGAFGLVFGFLATATGLVLTAATLRATEQGQYTDRYTQAIASLASTSPDVREGAVYSLERLAHDSPADRSTIVKVLEAYIQRHFQDAARRNLADDNERHLSVDVLAALDVAHALSGNNKWITLNYLNGQGDITLDQANLQNADVTKSDFTHALLSDSMFDGAIITHSDFTLADGWQKSDKSCLEIVDFSRTRVLDPLDNSVDFELANLRCSNFVDAHLNYAHFIHANLTFSTFKNADLSHADLTHADFRCADLSGANLTGADLQYADFRGAKVTSAQLASAKRNETMTSGAPFAGEKLQLTAEILKRCRSGPVPTAG